MKIEIADRLKPFSHTPGHESMIPATNWKAKVFPVAFFLTDSKSLAKIELFWDLKGPVDPFTVEEDLEGKALRIYGDAVQGYFRLVIQAVDKKLVLRFEKTPPTGISLLSSSGEPVKTFMSGDVFELSEEVEVCESFPKERLFLGSSKQKDWDGIRCRKDLREILPLWHLSGLISPCRSEEKNELLVAIEKAMEAKDPKKVFDFLLETYLAHFSAGLVPRAQDEEFQGILPLGASFKGIQGLLCQGSSLIRSLFFQEKENAFYILPCLPSRFVCGKMIGIVAENGCVFDLEWTKHKLRRIFIEVKQDVSLDLHFPPEVQNYRVRTSLKDRGHVVAKKEVVAAKAGTRLWLDLFQK